MRKVRIFRFRRNEFVDLTDSPERGCNVIQCGKYKYTLKGFQKQEGHDDSLPYTAILCINNKPVCRCLNDGWGGETEIKPIDIQAEAIIASANVTLGNYGWMCYGCKFNLDLSFIADTLAISESHES